MGQIMTISNSDSEKLTMLMTVFLNTRSSFIRRNAAKCFVRRWAIAHCRETNVDGGLWNRFNKEGKQ